MSGLRRKRTYDKEFKLEAIRLVLEEGRSAASVERELGTGQQVVIIISSRNVDMDVFQRIISNNES